MLAIINQLRRLCYKHQIEPANIKITVQFLAREDEARAEFALRKEAQGIFFDRDMTDCICEGRDFTIMGFRFKVQKYVEPPCNCWSCRARQDAWR